MRETAIVCLAGILAGSASAQTGAPAAPSQAELLPRCVPNVVDEATGNCLAASSVPEIGKLFPLGPQLAIYPGLIRTDGNFEADGAVTAAYGMFSQGLFGQELDADLLAARNVLIFSQSGPHTPSANLHVQQAGDATILLEADLFNNDEFAQPKITFSQDGGAVTTQIGFFGGSNDFAITNEFDADMLFNLPGGNADWEFFKAAGVAVDRKAYINQSGNMAIDGNYSSGGADVAEVYPVQGSIEPGDVVAFTGAGLTIARAVDGAGGSLAGIVSSDPGVVLGLTYTDEDETGENPEDLCAGDRLAAIRHEIRVNRRAPLALTGRVPCKVTAENGPIRAGDLLAVSSHPGHAMKATRSGPVLGTALEPWTAGEGSILVLANLGWFSPTADLERRVAELEAQVSALRKTR